MLWDNSAVYEISVLLLYKYNTILEPLISLVLLLLHFFPCFMSFLVSPLVILFLIHIFIMAKLMSNSKLYITDLVPGASLPMGNPR